MILVEGLSDVIMQLAGIGGFEWVIIIGLIVVVFFGVRKIPELARSFGKASGEFEKARLEAKRELQQMKGKETVVGREKLEAIADSLGIDYSNKDDEQLRAAIELELNKTKQ
ncbi:MAG: twin-arginine translocase TatA/TatE family subunit [Thermoproteota archaeon]|jgi:sec-independent protein translocase protein TatA|nr:twin-arginine translocase TatA/TatE family subunit [Thermoproteota archaeon]